ncbi:MAG: hypothetical protein IIZ93_07650 [Acidaminococcaceae bacterium]|nr:hypothetical protein [Acidaminococcaceae bacterium]
MKLENCRQAKSLLDFLEKRNDEKKSLESSKPVRVKIDTQSGFYVCDDVEFVETVALFAKIFVEKQISSAEKMLEEL